MPDLEARSPARVAAPARLITAAAVSLLVGACSQSGASLEPSSLASAVPQESKAAAPPGSELERATVYWGKEYAKNPGNLEAALNYATNLRAMGHKTQALAVLQQAATQHGNDKKLASVYGRLALELDQVSLAGKLLEIADDPVNPDWRVVSARGTVLAKQGQYKDAITQYERALTLAPGHPSVLSNLALAHAMNGEADKAEPLLRQAAEAKVANPKVRQNLALVLGLQGKYDEATRVAALDIPKDAAAANSEFMRRLVQVDAKPDTGQPVVAVAKAPAEVTPSAPKVAVAPWSLEVRPAQPAPQLKPTTQEPAESVGPWTTRTTAGL